MAPVKVDNGLVAANAARLAAHLVAHDCKAGDRIALYCGNGLEFVVAREAVTALDAVAVPINANLVAEEVRYVLAQSNARILLVDRDRQLAGREASQVEVHLVELTCASALESPRPDRVGATLIYTSGTTGLPKGCLRQEPQEMARATELIKTYSITEHDVHLIACPLAHSAPGIFLRAGRLVGAQTFVLPKFRAEAFLAAVQDLQASFFFLVPTQYERLLALPKDVRNQYDVSSIRAALVAGAPIAPATKQRIVAWLGADKLWEFYGSSETGTVSVLPPAEQLTRPGSVGVPAAGVELRLVDETGAVVGENQVGEIYVRSSSVMTGYIDQPGIDQPGIDQPGIDQPGIDHDGFISVGDLGRVDNDGYLYLVDRKHDTIISGGLNVYPAEVERGLHSHPAVTGVVAFGVADSDWGQIVAAAVAVNAAVTPQQLRAFLRDKIAAYKLPKAIAIIDRDELPIGSSGKPLRRAARELLAGNDRLVRCD